MTDSIDEELPELEAEPKPPSVLVIDQDELNLKVIKQVLSDLYEVVVATESPSAPEVETQRFVRALPRAFWVYAGFSAATMVGFTNLKSAMSGRPQGP